MAKPLKGLPELKSKLKALSDVGKTEALKTAVRSGALPILNEALVRVPRVTSNLARSLQVTDGDNGPHYAEAIVGTNVDYAARVELGFDGIDSLGRIYHQSAQPYLRPAFDQQRGAAIQEIADALRAILQSKV